MHTVMAFGFVILDSILHLRTIELKTILHLRKKSKIYNQLLRKHFLKCFCSY